MTIRYGARAPRPADGGSARPLAIDTWSTSVTATFLTDPDLIAAVLPPPLEPGAQPLVKIGISTVELGRGMGTIGAGTFAVAARHGAVEGSYPLLMPMTTEQAVTGGREIYGEPKKLAKIALDVDAEAGTLRASVSRMGTTIIEIDGAIGAEVPASGESERENVDFYFKFLRDPAGAGLDADPWLVHCTRTGETRSCRAVTGTVVLRDSKFDPVADFPILGEVQITLAERSSKQRGERVVQVPADDVLPFIHQRYDDLIVAAGKGA